MPTASSSASLLTGEPGEKGDGLLLIASGVYGVVAH